MSEAAVLSPAKARARERVHGLWIAIPTPFTADGRHVDEDALAVAVEHYVEGLKVDGIFCGGVMGEFWALTMDERRRVHELVVRGAAGRVPVMAQVGHHVFADTVALAAHALQAGADFGIAMNPYYPPRPPDELVRHWYRELAREIELPLFLFNTTYSGYSLSVDLIAELAELDVVCGIKDPQGTRHLLALHARVGDRIIVTDAAERDWLELHAEHGIQALMSTPALALYQRPGDLPIRDYTALADDGDFQGARRISEQLEGPRAAFDRWMRRPWTEDGVVPIAHLKTWLARMGLPQGPVRPPLVELSREQAAALHADVDRLGLGA